MTVEYLKSLVGAADRAWEAYEESENANLSEEETDFTYSLYHEAANKLANALVEGTGGAIDTFTAARMAHHKRNEILKIVV